MEPKYQVGQWVQLLGDKGKRDNRKRAHIIQRRSTTCEKETQYSYEIRLWENLGGKLDYSCTIKTFWAAEIEIEGVIEVI